MERPQLHGSKLFSPAFARGEPADFLALRRYPEKLPDHWWSYLISSGESVPADDAGWWRNSLLAHPDRLSQAKGSHLIAIKNAALSLSPQSASQSSPQADSAVCNASEWVRHLRENYSPFDPRKSEWTALEIVRTVVTPEQDIFSGPDTLNHIHPANVWIPRSWQDEFESTPSWEEWRNHARDHPAYLRASEADIEDYRFAAPVEGASSDNWSRQLVGLGRLLLGLLKSDFDGPRIWNLRGNERAVPFARRATYEEVAISSLTLRILEGALSARSAENWQFRFLHSLFGEDQPLSPNDMKFDAPPLFDPEMVIERIREAQCVLEENQIAVSRNQPRQLIPFRLADFAVGATPERQGEADAE